MAKKPAKLTADGVDAAAVLERRQYEIEVRYADGGVVSLGALEPGAKLERAVRVAEHGALNVATQHGQPGVWARVVEVRTSPRGERRTVVHEGDVKKLGKGKKATHSYTARAKVRSEVRSEVRPDG